MNESQPVALKRSWTSLWRTNPITMAFATLGLLAVVAVTTTVILNTVGLIKFDLLRFLSESDEAPIRVRNGSLKLELLDHGQEWEDVSKDSQNEADTKKKWRVKDRKRHQDKFDVTVAAKAGATCPDALTALEPLVRFTLRDSVNSSFEVVIFLEANGKKTHVLPQTGVMNGSSTLLEYGATNDKVYLSNVAAGASVTGLKEICSFANKDQLDSIVILNVK